MPAQEGFKGFVSHSARGFVGPVTSTLQITRKVGKAETIRLTPAKTTAYVTYDWGDRLSCTSGAVILRAGNMQTPNHEIRLFARPPDGERQSVKIDPASIAALVADYERAHPARAAIVPPEGVDLRSWAGGSSR